MTDRKERQHVIKVLKNMLDWMEAANRINSTPERIEAVKYAIASIETDLKYDLLYEETSGQADKPITKNCESCRYYGSHHKVCNYCYKCSLWTEQESTNKNDLPRFLHTDEEDEEIAKSFIEDVEAVKDQLPCFCEQMDFPNTFDEFADYYGFKDTEEVYTNGNELIQVFRVKQWLEHISTTKNDLGVEEVTALAEWTEKLTKASEDAYNKGFADGMKAQEPRKGHWISRPHIYGVAFCSECGFELKINNTNYCPNCGAKMEEVKE